MDRTAGEQRGLTTTEAAARLERDGPNELPTPPPPSIPRLLLEQFVHFFAVMLWVAAGLAFLGQLPALSVAIVFVILINGVFAFLQEYRAVRAAERLRDLLPERVWVRRDGERREIDPTELVVGDVVELQVGDRVSADLAVLESHALRIETAALTGESVPVAVEAGESASAGTFVVEGEGVGRVEATGADTRLAGIATLTQAEERPTSPLRRELDRVVRTIGTIAVGVGVLFLAVSVVLGTTLSNAFLFAVGVTVALVPEGLLPTVTLSLAYGARRMADRNALVRHLESVETLGSATFICTDKTGTLTRNQMAVVDAWTPDGRATVSGEGYEPTGSIAADEAALPALERLATAARTASNGRIVEEDGEWIAQGDPTEAALDAFARRLGCTDDAEPPRHRFPFDSVRKRMSVVVGDRVFVKGAPESVFPRCEDGPERLDTARAVTDEMTGDGLRVLAVATRAAPAHSTQASVEAVESELTLLGLVGMHDPPREDVRSSLEACRESGVGIAMITGDHAETARAIADDVGLRDPDDPVVEADELPDDDADLGAALDRDGIVVSRVAPEQKLQIAEALQARGHVVAMTGDGVNDGPALQQADIGVAMGASGTDVAREAADLVLLDDHFATIVTAIELGRATFSNIRKFLTYHLTDNVAELTPFVLWGATGGRFPLAIGVLQILAIDLVTDQFPSLALAVEPPTDEQRKRPLAGQHLIDRTVLRRVFGVLGPTVATASMVAFVLSLWVAGWVPGAPPPTGPGMLAASGAAWATIILGQTANAFAVRSASHWPGALGWTSNRYLPWAVLSALVFMVVLLFVRPVATLLGQAPPPLVGGVVAVLVVPALLVADLVDKRLRRDG